MGIRSKRTGREGHGLGEPGLGWALMLTASLASFITLLSRMGLAELKSALQAEGEALLACMTSAQSMPAVPEGDAERKDAAYYWEKTLLRLPDDLTALGLTRRQVQVGMGIVQQKSYPEIAKEMRLEERTVRQHAEYAFRKVGCRRKTDFLEAVMEELGKAFE